MILEIPAHITKIETTSDRGIKFVLYTQELVPEQAAIAFRLKDRHGFFLFKETQFREEDVKDLPDFVPEFKGEKSPSQRLRAVLYRIWESGGKNDAFESFYKIQMEKIIDHFKEKLAP